MCKYCIGYFDNTQKSELFKVNTNVPGMSFAFIAKGDKKAEMVLSTENGVFGIEVDKCPVCGEELKEKT